MKTCFGMLNEMARLHGDREAFVMLDDGQSLSFEQLRDRSSAMASALLASGLRRGDAIAFWLPNCLEWPILFFAATQIGLRVIPLNTRLRTREISHLLNLSGCRSLVVMPTFNDIDFLGMTEEVMELLESPDSEPPLHLLIIVGAYPKEYGGTIEKKVRTLNYSEMNAGATPTFKEESLPEDICVAFSTTGTTSLPKLAAHDQHGVVTHASNLAHSLRLTSEDVILGLLPPCGIFGFGTLMASIAAGSTIVLMPMFSYEDAIKCIQSHGVTFLAANEGMFRQLLKTAFQISAPLSSLSRGGVGGTNVRDIIETGLHRHGTAIVNLYGSSEASAMIGIWDFNDSQELISIPGGRLVGDGAEVRVVHTQDRSELPIGQVGELQFSGANTLREYLGNPSATAAAFTHDGWFSSGDLGRVLLEGRAFEFHSRLSDGLRLKGFLVNPSEIEELLHSHRDIQAVAVVGVWDVDSGGHRPVAFVVLEPKSTITEEELRDFCKLKIANFKVPERFIVLEELPMIASANGDKIQKRALQNSADAIIAEMKI